MAKITYEQLIAYAVGELTPERAAEVAEHVARDREAAATVARYREAQATMRADDVTDPPARAVARAKAIFSPPRTEKGPSWWEQLEHVLATLIFDSRLQPALAGYRGAGSGFHLSFESKPGMVDLEAEPIERSSAGIATRPSWRLTGQIDAETPVSNVGVALVRRGSDRPAAQAVADEEGIFTLEAPPGRYDLYLRHDDSSIVLRDIELA